LYWKGESDKGLEELCKLVGQGWEDELKTLKRTGWEKLEKENSLNGIEKQGAAEEKSEEIAEEIGQVTQEAEEVREDEEDVNELIEGVKGVKIEGAGNLDEDTKSDGGVDGNDSKPSM
jgi:NAD-dependent histone deacetylase SIR2